MKKKSLAALSFSLVLVIMAASACSKSNNDSSASTPAATSQETTATETGAPPAKNISFNYATFIGDFATDQVGAAAIDYTQLNPNIKVNHQTMDHDTYQQKVSTMVESNTLPDLFWWNGSQLSTTMLNKPEAIVDLTSYFDNDFKSRFLPNAFDFLNKANGKIAGFPSEAQVQGFWYNKALFDKYNLEFPKTFEDLLNVVKVFKENGIIPIAQGTKDPWPIWAWYMWEEKYGYIEEQESLFHTRTLHLKDSGIAKVFHRLSELHDAGAFPENASTMNFDQMTALFAAGKAAIIQLSSDQLGKFQNQPIENDMKFSWGPDFTDSKYDQHVAVKTVNNGYAIGSNAAKDPEKLQAIVDFNKWRYSDDGVKATLKAGFILPVKTDSIDLSQYSPLVQEQAKALNDDYKALNMDIQYTIPYYLADGTPLGNFWGPKDAALNAIVDGSLKSSDIDKEIERLDKILDDAAKGWTEPAQ
ncbi:ABC transporter substrate-binding protein [Cohnella nanjingensis]|uniref:Extracellular solute-binding protein n=1 Tax=Cohnella nanjingensis TaxID=1387779 RepID=A0A7X0VFN8_9BACL|nr:extracellular solute-binding protein [Cohnella nanjingensis]MBB6670809.1 extracellular solute-binding protein [Cohnella nanjingensis]